MNNRHSWARTVDTPNLSSSLTLNFLAPIASGLGSPVVAVRPRNVNSTITHIYNANGSAEAKTRLEKVLGSVGSGENGVRRIEWWITS